MKQEEAGQRPQREQSPVEHGGTFVLPLKKLMRCYRGLIEDFQEPESFLGSGPEGEEVL